MESIEINPYTVGLLHGQDGDIVQVMSRAGKVEVIACVYPGGRGGDAYRSGTKILGAVCPGTGEQTGKTAGIARRRRDGLAHVGHDVRSDHCYGPSPSADPFEKR